MSSKSEHGISTAAITVPARIAYLSLIDEMIQWVAGRVGMGKDGTRDLSLIVDEGCTNVMSYAYPDDPEGLLTVQCAALSEPKVGISVTIVDHGVPFDPEKGLGIGEEKRARDPASGGRGLLLIYQLADETRYEWSEEGGNRFTLTKYASPEPSTHA